MGKGFYSPLYFLAVAYGDLPSAHNRQDHRKISYRRKSILGSDPPGFFCRLSWQSSGAGETGENGRSLFSHTASDSGRNALFSCHSGTAGVPGRDGRAVFFRLGQGELAGAVCASAFCLSARSFGKCKETRGYRKSYVVCPGSAHRTSDSDTYPSSGKLWPGRL